MSKRRARASRKGRHRAQRVVRLASGAGSAAAIGLDAPEGFAREHVLDLEGRPSTVIRRIDNLTRLRATLGGERVNALMALRMATEAMERGLTPRCGLDMSPGAGPDGFLALMQHRLNAALFAGQMWGAVPRDCELSVRVIVLQGWSVIALARDQGGRVVLQQRKINGHLKVAADAINALLDERFGRAKVRAGSW
jgi:hypothetical protein